MAVPDFIRDNIALPVIGAPMLMPCHPPLAIAQCTAGIIGAFPALSARPQELFEEWIVDVKDQLGAFRKAHPERKVAPFAVNQIVHKSNLRMEKDLETCIKHKVPIIITSLGVRSDIVAAVHAYGGIVFHDVLNMRHVDKVLSHGVDGLVLLCAGAGGQGGYLNPFAFVSEVRRHFDGMLAVAGCITNGRGIVAMQTLGADFAYIGTRFIPTPESRAPDGHKEMIVACGSDDILGTDKVNGVFGNWLKPSLIRFGLDPDHLELNEEGMLKFEAEPPKAWRDLWPGSHAIGDIVDIVPVATIVERLKAEYAGALEKLRG